MTDSETKNKTALDDTLLVRNKKTDIEQTLDPIAELVGEGRTRFKFIDLDGAEIFVDAKTRAQDDPMRIPMPVDREFYATLEMTSRYWATGQADWLNVQQGMKKVLSKPGSPCRVFDFGCASGRFLRHVWMDRQELDLDVWGCDFSPQNVEWCKRYLDGDIKVVLNHAMPHLPFPDNYFDVVTAFSVFTHIDQFEDAWLLELRRITRDDGLLYVTISNQSSWDLMLERGRGYEKHLKANDIPGNIEVTKELFEKPMEHDRIVFRFSNKDVYNCNVWMTNQFVRERWGRYFDVVDISESAHNSFQSVVLLQPK